VSTTDIGFLGRDYGYPNRTYNVTITGTNLTGATGVSFGPGVTVNILTVTATQITANIAIASDAAAGPRTVTVNEPWPQESPGLEGAFSVAVPAVTAVTPNTADQGNTLDVIITGTYLTDATEVGFGSGITVNSKTVNNPTQITANITIANTATPGTRTVAVSTPYNTPTLTNGFTVTQVIPTVTSIDPNQGVQGQTLTVTITGTDLTGATAVSLGEGVTISPFIVDSDTQISASVTIAADADPVARDVSVTTPFGTATLASGFTVLPPAPTITSVEPAQGKRRQTLDVVITGTDFTGATEMSFGEGITVNTLTVDDATQITVNITIAKDTTEGVRDVSVTTAGGTGTLTEGFMVKGKKGGGCSCGTISEPTPPRELLIGWGIILACAAAAYWAATRVGRQKTKPISSTLGRP
jgi:hypothetical protein